ncbi:ArsR/SmtB family transcription factor [Clostridium nigeriense]|uniref:ArsR/SmtB family transcription factor n=1 Tax=Clostridium nigeriense TaxID=1805470 RepID=UPI003D349B15
MENCYKRRIELAKELKACKKAFIALGDETRQQIIVALLESEVHGIRVGEITEKTHLSRPAVSHHLQILKEAGIINMYREGTKNYYYVSADETIWNQIRNLFNKINEVVEDISERDCNKSQIEIESEKEFI